MPSALDEKGIAAVQDWIDLIIGKRSKRFSYEREIRLYQLQILIYFPHLAPRNLHDAARLIASRLLFRIEKKVLKRDEDLLGTADGYVKAFANPKYRSLFDAVFEHRRGRMSGWYALTAQDSTHVLEYEISEQVSKVEPVVRIMDHMFRSLEDGLNKKAVGIKRSQVWLWKDRDVDEHEQILPVLLSGKAIRKRWSEFKLSSIFLYVDQTFCNGLMVPQHPGRSATIDRLSNLYREKLDIISFLRQCDYVGNKVKSIAPELWPFNLDDSVGEQQRPIAAPLTLSDKKRLDNFKEDAGRFDDN